MGAGVRDAFPPPMCVGGYNRYVVMKKSTTPKGVASSLALLPRVGCVVLANPALSKVQPRWGRGTPRGLVEMGRGGAYVPARVALQGRIRR